MIAERATLISLAALVLLSACAEKSENVTSTYVSPNLYAGYSCGQIQAEAQRVSARASQVAGAQDSNAQGDAVATGVALVLFWPAVFFIDGDKQNAAELGRLKGELEALEQVSIQKNCGIEFRRG